MKNIREKEEGLEKKKTRSPRTEGRQGPHTYHTPTMSMEVETNDTVYPPTKKKRERDQVPFNTDTTYNPTTALNAQMSRH